MLHGSHSCVPPPTVGGEAVEHVEDISISRLLPWIKKGGLVMLDQALFSGANFLVSILLARWLPPEEYGAFAVALSVFYLLAAFHTAVLAEPMLVFGAGKFRKQFRKYLGMVLYAHWGLAGGIALLLGGAALVTDRFGSAPMARALLGLALASPFLLLLWLSRRACYVHLRPFWAMVGSAVYFGIVGLGMFSLAQSGRISVLSSLLVLGTAGTVGALQIISRLNPQLCNYAGNPTPSMLVADHWRYGKWNLLGILSRWGSMRMLRFVIPLLLGLPAAAAVSASSLLYSPIQRIVQSVGTITLPYLARLANSSKSRGELGKKTLILLIALPGLVSLYGIVLTALSKPILHWLYGGKYDHYWVLIPLFGINSVLSAAAGSMSTVLKAQQDSQAANAILVLAMLGFFVTVWPLTALFGLGGAVLSVAVGQALGCFRGYREVFRRRT
jgi:O-antigen/teichoic acid export membrane protein